MTVHEFAHKIKPLWKALIDIENIGYDIYRNGDYNRAMDISRIARDTRAKFNSEEQEMVDNLLKEIRK